MSCTNLLASLGLTPRRGNGYVETGVIGFVHVKESYMLGCEGGANVSENTPRWSQQNEIEIRHVYIK
jgi:hypothetical protein